MRCSRFRANFFEHSIQREYLALIWGVPKESRGTIRGNIGRHPTDRIKMAVYPEGDVGKHAVTHYELINDYYYVSLVKCWLETGRTHQIRVHMSHGNNPLFNDDKYGGDKIVKGTVFSKYKQFVQNCFKVLPRQALHAHLLGFVHPGTGEKMQFISDLPEDFSQLLDKWKRYTSGRKD